MTYKPYIYRMLDGLFGSIYQQLQEAEMIKETKKAYLIQYCGQDRWIPKQFVRNKENKIKIEKWIFKTSLFKMIKSIKKVKDTPVETG